VNEVGRPRKTAGFRNRHKGFELIEIEGRRHLPETPPNRE
jgi:hypothetical protein